MFRSSRFLVVAAILSITGTLSASVQAATLSGQRDVPAASECTIALADANSLLTWFKTVESTPAADDATAATVPTPTPFAEPSGAAATPETMAAVVTAVREVMACTNNYGFPGLVAVSTHRHIESIFVSEIAAGATYAEAEQELALPSGTPTPDQSVAFVGVRNVVVLPDGRIGAVVVGDEPGAGVGEVYFIFAKEGDRLLLDEEYDEFVAGTPTP